ncbi:unnamed protein product [Onchocerca flexuosa]|uniref:Cytochrome c oxidase subunit 1 n=1 Tax=Onchocerca flexuosa TaxID=387005 RepID=A0A183GZB1_9BILA|nr:unnamed protein product [Onchocerca flexuosa]
MQRSVTAKGDQNCAFPAFRYNFFIIFFLLVNIREMQLEWWVYGTQLIFRVSPEKVIELKESRWTLYPPLSQIMFHQVQGLTLLYFHIVGMSSVVGAINFIVTLFNIRAKGMSLTKMPLFA